MVMKKINKKEPEYMDPLHLDQELSALINDNCDLREICQTFYHLSYDECLSTEKVRTVRIHDSVEEQSYRNYTDGGL